MRLIVLTLTAVNPAGTMVTLSDGRRHFVSTEHHHFVQGWRVGEEVFVVDAPDQPRGYLLSPVADPRQVVSTLVS